MLSFIYLLSVFLRSIPLSNFFPFIVSPYNSSSGSLLFSSSCLHFPVILFLHVSLNSFSFSIYSYSYLLAPFSFCVFILPSPVPAIPCPIDRRNPASPRWPRSFGRCALAQGGSRPPPPFGALPAPAAPGKPARKRPLGRGEGKSLGFSLEPWASRARRAAMGRKGPGPRAQPLRPARRRPPV